MDGDKEKGLGSEALKLAALHGKFGHRYVAMSVLQEGVGSLILKTIVKVV